MARINGRVVYNRIYEIISTLIILCGVVFAAMYLRGIRLYHVKSGSMGDILPVGCICFVDTHYKYANIKTGDVIAFRVDDDLLVTHRAVKLTDEGIYTRGDENNTIDPDPVTKENYIGRTFYEIPHIGLALEFLYTKKGAAVIAGIVIAITFAGFIYRKNKE